MADNPAFAAKLRSLVNQKNAELSKAAKPAGAQGQGGGSAAAAGAPPQPKAEPSLKPGRAFVPSGPLARKAAPLSREAEYQEAVAKAKALRAFMQIKAGTGDLVLVRRPVDARPRDSSPLRRREQFGKPLLNRTTGPRRFAANRASFASSAVRLWSRGAELIFQRIHRFDSPRCCVPR